MLAAPTVSHGKGSGNEGPEPLPSVPRKSGPCGIGTEDPHHSSQAAFLEAARSFDPHAITRNEMAAMAALLLALGGVSERDHLILKTDPTAGRMAVARDLSAPRDAVRDWQERRATDMERGRVPAVEASTRALAILGRVAALRSQRRWD